ncbi:MAG: putative terminase large subunit [Prokaryotic dsDNA virus sp.]|nr:DNA maturase B [Flavobacteriaceae bacterium]QDP68320.1 MAG: putative terminase large subunit [Prokaryotic dsDNA virus sp.]
MYSDKYMKGLEKDFRNFCHHIWKSLDLPPLTPVQNDIAWYLQHGPERCIVEAFRGVGKSYLTAAYVCWKLKYNRDLEILVVSAGKDRADAFAIFVRNLIRNVDILKHMEPDKNKGHRATQNIFDVNGRTTSGSPSVKSVGITGQITGSRADIIIADDIEVVSNSATHDLREKLARLVTEFDAVIKPNGRNIYLGTPQTEMSLYNTLYNRGYEVRIWCAQVPTEQQALSYGPKLAPFIRKMMETKDAGTTTDTRFTDEDLAKRLLSYGRSGFALQFMLDTSLSDADKFPLKIDDLIISHVGEKLPNEIYWSKNPLVKLKDLPNVATAGQDYYSHEKLSDGFSEPMMRTLAIDPSGRGKDETAYAVGFMLHGNIFVPDAGGIVGGYSDDAMIQLAEIAKKYKVNKIIIESNFGDGMFSQLLKPHLTRIYPCSVDEVRQNIQKELRIIDTLEPVMNQHRLIIDPQVIQKDYDTAMERYTSDTATKYMLFYQMTRLSKERGSLAHDDRLDALAMMVQYFLEQLSVDQHMQEQQRREEAFDAQLDKFIEDWYDMGYRSNNQGLRIRNMGRKHQ